MQLEVWRQPVEPQPAATAAPPPLAPRAAPRARAVKSPTPRSEARSTPAAEAEVTPPAEVAPPTPSVAATGDRNAPPRTLDLSPRAAAYALQSETASSWSAAAQHTDERDVDRSSEDRLARNVAALSRSDGTDRTPGVHLAQDVNSVIAKPWDLITQPLRKARYRYRGVGFDAIIRADGSVAYRSKTGLQAMGGQAKSIDGEPISTFGLGFHDAPADKLLGRDTHASERRTFLEQTRALRELLHERATRVALARAEAHLSQRLGVIALRLQTGDDRRARRELFALWDECSEDEVGATARKRIEAFVREQCAVDSALAFSSAELSALNQKRSSRAPFTPYSLDPTARDAGS